MKFFRLIKKTRLYLKFQKSKPNPNKETNILIFTKDLVDTGGFKTIPKCTKIQNTLNYHCNVSKTILWEKDHQNGRKSLQECLKTFAPSPDKNKQNIDSYIISNKAR